jgi:hypothetical protein
MISTPGTPLAASARGELGQRKPLGPAGPEDNDLRLELRDETGNPQPERSSNFRTGQSLTDAGW